MTDPSQRVNRIAENLNNGGVKTCAVTLLSIIVPDILGVTILGESGNDSQIIDSPCRSRLNGKSGIIQLLKQADVVGAELVPGIPLAIDRKLIPGILLSV